MTDRPIIFSASMVLALLAGRKTQTRRLAWGEHRPVTIRSTGGPSLSPWQRVQPGDRLWVREAWALPSNWTGPASRIAASCQEAGYKRPWAPIHYPADGTRDNWGHWREHEPGKVRSPIHMPRWASRLTLTVTDVRVQRLQDIVLDDVLAEGCPIDPDFHDTTQDGSGSPMVKIGIAQWRSPRGWYHVLWDELHDAGAWDANPEVVAISFRCETRNIDA